MTGLVSLFGAALVAVVLTSWRQISFAASPSLFALQLSVATLLPLFGYLFFLRLGYATWSWAPFSYGSLLPLLIAALSSAVALFVLLRPQTFRLATKLSLVSACAVIWALSAAAAGFYTACSVGDCL